MSPAFAESDFRLAVCESEIMKAMPLIATYFDSCVYLERPEFQGLRPNPLGAPEFKCGWIDNGRRMP
jgi:hypothetical protein